MARPKKQIDYETVKKLASIQCTQEEIANFLELSVSTLKRDAEFCTIYKNGIDNGKMSLRRYQFECAKKGNSAMLIWLGKQYLGQTDSVAITNTKLSDDEMTKSIKEKLGIKNVQ